MFSRNHGKPHTETYRFSATPTLSDFPLLIGEMLRLSDLRSKRQASHRSLFQKIRSRLTPIAQFRTRTSPAWRNHMKIGILRAERIL
jgi:hypothetical protein